ncbi:hypothetical protein DMO17_18585 [Aquipseudomonas alcaligenes]|uniref:DUF1501 domain-containing protein n=1 Tax=Aquipseudomonas alcaligenes TaxID=43263 RepID=A0A2V4KF28_AQUAC|nr:DUF1501 domain-containing protein [Pseudomonas alcaligenes]PYC20205.1 hypothetical protein DMO17_18585 [Pseudomonas alcaligenes]
MKRRELLKVPFYLGASTLMGSLLQKAYAASDYKALVCIFLHGGNDSFNMLVPRNQALYDVYQRARGNMHVSESDLAAPAFTDNDSVPYALPLSMPFTQTLADAGKVAAVANIGPRGPEPIVGDGGIPRLFSHNDQQSQWMTLQGASDLRTGWAGRLDDIWDAQPPLNYSVSGNNLWQLGEVSKPYIMSLQSGVRKFDNLNPASTWQLERKRHQSIVELLRAGGSSPAERYYAKSMLRAMELSELHYGVVNYDPLNDPFAGLFNDVTNPLLRQMRYVALTMRGRNILGANRHIFYVSLGGFDTHDHQLENHPKLLAQLDAGIKGLYQACAGLGITENVTIFTASEFGRTLTSNGDGTDHGWGGHQLVIGDAVRGGKIYGKMPSLSLGSDDDFGFGRIKPSLSVEQYVADLLVWFGLSESQINQVLPNLPSFAQRSLGYMQV